jgi:anti-sigma factor RsiW
MRRTPTACPPATDWLQLVDGEVVENRAGELRAHAAGCPACAGELARAEALVARIGAPVPGLPSPGALEALMARLDEAPPTAERRPRALLLGGAAGLAAAAALLLAVRWWPLPDDRDTFTARGGDVEWTRKVGVELWALEEPLRELLPGATFSPGTPIVASYSNVDGAPAWLLAFALDEAGEVHWLYPAFLDPRSDPPAVRLEGSVVHRALPEAAVLDGLPRGPVRFVLVVSREPLKVSDVERLTPAERDPERLRMRWPRARVEVLPAWSGPRPGDAQEGASR